MVLPAGLRRVWSARLCGACSLVLLSFMVSACTGQWIIDQDVSAYRDSFARASDEQVLKNILFARDNLPLHFAEVNTIGASVQQSASLNANIPFSHTNGSTARDTLSPTIGVQNNPQVSMGTLETQDFTKGLLSPVDPALIKQFLDRGTDPRIILLLFFSGVKAVDDAQFSNTFRCTDLHVTRCYEEFFGYLGYVDKIYATVRSGRLHLHIYNIMTPFGPPVAADGPDKKAQLLPKDISGIDPSKFDFKQLTSGPDAGKFQLYKVSGPKIALCAEDARHRPVLSAFTRRPSRACTDASIIGAGAQIRAEQFEIRSVYQIIQYLGQILELQATDAPEHRCIVLDQERERRSCSEGDVLFQVNSSRGQPVVSTAVNGVSYTVSDAACHELSCDHSTEVLGILTLLLNANKVAKDIPNPSIVQVIQ